MPDYKFGDTLFTEDEKLHDQLLTIACVPAMMLFFIECVQLKKSGVIEYFSGWNIIDFMHFWVFITLQIMTRGQQNDSGRFIPELKMTLIIMAFVKLLFYIRIFESYGFLVQMITACVKDLIPFLMAYWTFLIVFSICFISLNMEIDADVDEADGIGHL
jgi:hypothetical protein